MFDAREQADALPTEPFPFIGMDGVTYELPNASVILGHQAVRLYKGDLEVIREVGGEEPYDAVMSMPARLHVEIANAWTRHAMESGKEDSPSSRRPSSAKRSKST
jgi:hypothetical protein